MARPHELDFLVIRFQGGIEREIVARGNAVVVFGMTCGTTIAAPHWVHLPRFPDIESATVNRFPHLGQARRMLITPPA